MGKVRFMDKSLKELLIKNSKFTITISLIISFIVSIVFGIDNALVYLLGSSISIINFIANGILINKFLLSNRFLIKFGYIVRIFIIIIFVIPFSRELSLLLSYIGGFITCHVCLIIYWIFIRKGSE